MAMDLHNLFAGSCWDVKADSEVIHTSERQLYHVPVNLEPAENSSLQAALKYRCSDKVGVRFHRLPPVLVFHLERNMTLSTATGALATNRRFTFPQHVDLLRYSLDYDNPLADRAAYEFVLAAVVVRGGDHCWTYAKIGTAWRLYDDAHTELVSELPDSIFGGGEPGSGSAYLLMYEHKSRSLAAALPGRHHHGLGNPPVHQASGPVSYCCYANSVLQALATLPEFHNVQWNGGTGGSGRHRELLRHMGVIMSSLTGARAPDPNSTVRFIDAWQAYYAESQNIPIQRRRWRTPSDPCEFFAEIISAIAKSAESSPLFNSRDPEPAIASISGKPPSEARRSAGTSSRPRPRRPGPRRRRRQAEGPPPAKRRKSA